MKVIGVMSGSSLDGIDVACCSFDLRDGRWAFTIERARTVDYDNETRERLLHATEASALELARSHHRIGELIGSACAEVLKEHPADLIASHGHTVFHQPGEGFTTQIGCGATIAVRTGLPTICDFRTKDLALGGQGAPLVPLGERMLFPEHDCFLNLGGISNISLHREAMTIGYDIGPCNQALNRLAEEAGQPFDRDGSMAKNGRIVPDLLAKLNELLFYAQIPPRSLGREWFDEHMAPLIDDPRIPLSDRLRTMTTHAATMAARELNAQGPTSVMITGGGAHNGFLVELIRSMTTTRVEVPENTLINFKEALIFAFLGLLRYRGEVNTLASVTGASHDSVGGAVYLPN